MNRPTLAFLTAAALIGWTSCGGGGGGGNPPTPPVTGGGSITGLVANESGTPLADVRVTAGAGAAARNGTTNEQGFFALTGIPAGEPLVRYERSGHVSSARVVEIVDGRNSQVSAVLRSIGTSQTIDTTQAGVVTHAGGKVSLPANGVVDANGLPVGSAVVSLTTMNPDDPGYTSFFPGEFVGVDGGQRTLLLSYGVLDVELRAADGAPLRLAAGASAELEFPIPGNDPGDATIPLWYLDPATGIWVREGQVQRDAAAGVFRGTVTHFTPWNVDKPTPSAWKRIRLTHTGNPVVGISVRLFGPGMAAGGITGSNGEVLIPVPASINATVQMLLSDGRWITLRTNEPMPPSGQTIVNHYTEADGVVQQLATVILRWGERPTDLDSHMTIPTTPGRSHVYYRTKGSLTASPWVALDTDDVTSFGPEIVTVTRALPGVYRYTIHNFSTNAQHPIEQSGATVTLVLRDQATRTFTVPTANPGGGNYWAVFDLSFDSAGNPTVTEINQFGGAELLRLE